MKKDLIIFSKLFLHTVPSYIFHRSISRHFLKSTVERTFWGESTSFRNILHQTLSVSQQLLGVFDPVAVYQLFQVTSEIPVHHIGHIGLVCSDKSTQLIQWEWGIQEHHPYLHLIEKWPVDLEVYLSSFHSLTHEILLPLLPDSLWEKLFLSLRSGASVSAS